MKFVINPDPTDLVTIVNLINQAYRGNSGQYRWTSEADLVEGDRITLPSLKKILADSQYDFITAVQNNELLGCISIHYFDDIAEFGTFAIQPSLHGQGLGKQLLAYAEHHAQQRCQRLQVSVVNLNQKLINFYLKRGYQSLNLNKPYPVDEGVGKPKVSDISLVLLQKQTVSIPPAA